MVASLLSRRALWRMALAALFVVAAVSLIGVTMAHAQAPLCPSRDYWYDPDTGECVPYERVECGAVPYRFNAFNGEWERPFNMWCSAYTDDPFDTLFHGMTYAEAQAKLAELGLGGLSREQQLAALVRRGFGSESGEYAPVVTPTPVPIGKPFPDCGQNPYNYNAIGGHFERKFDARCLPFTGDPNEVTLDGKFLYGE